MTILNLIDDSAELAAQLFGQPHAEEFRDTLAVSRQRPISQLGSKILWIGKLRLKMKLPDGVEA